MRRTGARSWKLTWLLSLALCVVLAFPSITLADDGTVTGMSVTASQTYVAGGGAQTVFPDLTITGTGSMQSATVNIDSNFNSSRDSLSCGAAPAGLTASYNSASGVLTITGSADMNTYQNFLRTVKLTTSSTSGTRSVVLLVSTTTSTVVYYDYTKHFYEFVRSPGITWTNARTAAASRTFAGYTGYLATVTSSGENAFVTAKCAGAGWLGGSDAASEGTWKWMTGPEAGTQFWSGAATGSAVGGQYTNWTNGLEPNNSGGTENYLHILGPNKSEWPGWAQSDPRYSPGDWNDYADNDSTIVGYVVEYGDASGIDITTFTQSKTVNLTISATPTMTADNSNNDVDHDITITYPADSTYKNSITEVDVGGVKLDSSAYTLADGSITINTNGIPNIPGSYTITVKATGYGDASISQPITAGAASTLTVTTEPVPGANSGNAFATQPVVKLYDDYGNLCSTGPSASAGVTAAPAAGTTGSWTIGGSNSIFASGGIAAFSGLTCTTVTPDDGAITFTSGLNQTNSNSFTLPNWSAKVLTADATDNDVDHSLEITFPADSTFESGITSVTYRGVALTPSVDYTVSSGKITLLPAGGNSVLTTSGAGTLTISSAHYDVSSVSQTITAGQAASLSVSTEPVPGVNSGNTFATQPVVTLKDQYGNVCSTGPSASAGVTAAPTAGTSGTWTIGGTAAVTAVNGVASYTNLTCTQTVYGKGGITFTSGSLATSSSLFDLPKIAAKPLAPATGSYDVDHPMEVNFPADPAFESLITGVTYKGIPLQEGTDYRVESGKLILLPAGGNAALKSAGTGDLVVSAAGYHDAVLSLTIVPVKPTVTTKAATGVGNTEVTGNGVIASNGGVPITERGFVYSLNENPTVDSGTKVASSSVTDAFTARLTPLSTGTAYHIRAYAVNSAGISYGEDIVIRTLTPQTAGPAKITTDTPAGTLFHGMTLSANIATNVGDVITQRGFVYSATNISPEYGDKDAQTVGAGHGTGPFTATLTDLTPGATYYVRAYASGSSGFSYGQVMKFTIPLGDGVAGIPKTGDGAGISFLLLAAGAALLGTIAVLKRRRTRG